MRGGVPWGFVVFAVLMFAAAALLFLYLTGSYERCATVGC